MRCSLYKKCECSSKCRSVFNGNKQATFVWNGVKFNISIDADLSHCHGTVTLVIPKLCLLVWGYRMRRVLQVRVGSTDGFPKDLLQALVDVQHILAVLAHLFL